MMPNLRKQPKKAPAHFQFMAVIALGLAGFDAAPAEDAQQPTSSPTAEAVVSSMKRAEWVDYIGPDASGKTVGIAMFDHPSNLRYLTHWHSRTYGLLAANQFGTDHFDPKF
ncbi:MAG: hypothetical protein ACI8UO_002704 [Verrucomicrobiales bacterium]|jgi:hypothetical protein